MAQMGRPGLSSQQKEELWERWKTGQSLSDIGQALGQARSLCFWRAAVQGWHSADRQKLDRGARYPYRIGRKYRAAWSRVCPCAKSPRSLGDRHQRSPRNRSESWAATRATLAP